MFLLLLFVIEIGIRTADLSSRASVDSCDTIDCGRVPSLATAEPDDSVGQQQQRACAMSRAESIDKVCACNARGLTNTPHIYESCLFSRPIVALLKPWLLSKRRKRRLSWYEKWRSIGMRAIRKPYRNGLKGPSESTMSAPMPSLKRLFPL